MTSSAQAEGTSPGPPPTTKPALAARPGRSSGAGADDAWDKLQRCLALVAIVVLGMRLTVASSINVTAGLLLAVTLAPLWTRVLPRYRGARLLMVLGSGAAIAGFVLTQLNSRDHGSSTKELLANTVMLLTLMGGTGLVLWARTLVSVGAVTSAFGTGMLLGVSSTSGLYSSNPWRFGFSVPITVLVLGVALLLGRRWIELVAVAVLMVVSAASDARSSSAILFLTGLFVAWQMVMRTRRGRGSAVRVVVAVGLLAAIVYSVGESLILSGSLGDETQQRSQAQVDMSGSLILGGRPELAATASLMSQQPFGFGSGTLPSHADLNVAKAGMAAINYDPDNGYVERFMFGSGFELHSTIGDLWANFGIVGLALAAAVVLIALRGFGDLMSARAGSGIVLFLTIKMLWNMAFAPLGSAVPLLMLLLGLVLVRRSTADGPATSADPRLRRAPAGSRPSRLTVPAGVRS